MYPLELCNPYGNNVEGVKAWWWYRELFNLAISAFDWQGLPSTINRDYLEWSLLTQGSAIWLKDNDGNLRALYGGAYEPDCYNFPRYAIVNNHALGALTGEFGVNAVWMRNNKLAEPITALIQEYASKLAKLDVNIQVNLQNAKSTKVFIAEDDPQAQQIRKLYDDVTAGMPAVIVNDGILSDPTRQIVFSSAVDYIVPQALKDQRTIINEYLAKLGINSLSVEKAERLVVSEAEANKQELEISGEYWLATRREAADEVNRIFGTNISVKIKSVERAQIGDDDAT